MKLDQVIEHCIKWADDKICEYEDADDLQNAYAVYREWDEWIVANDCDTEMTILTTPYEKR
jgi:hypothetical protein